jgi:hypothetical protein
MAKADHGMRQSFDIVLAHQDAGVGTAAKARNALTVVAPTPHALDENAIGVSFVSRLIF